MGSSFARRRQADRTGDRDRSDSRGNIRDRDSSRDSNIGCKGNSRDRSSGRNRDRNISIGRNSIGNRNIDLKRMSVLAMNVVIYMRKLM